MRAVLVLTLLLLKLECLAWGPVGHRIVGEIAQKHLNLLTKQRIKKLAGHQTLAMMANWADFVKSDPSYNYTYDWHFVSIPDDKTYEESEKNPNGDIIEAIIRLSKVLENRKESKEKRAEALKLLIHFVGDIHQPLHVGRKEDRGGNKVNVTWFGKASNLHSVWDESLVEFTKYSSQEYAEYLEATFKDIVDNKTKKKWAKDELMVWVKESQDWRTRVYDLGDTSVVGYEYIYYFKNKNYLEQRLYQAGIRLAALLNRVL